MEGRFVGKDVLEAGRFVEGRFVGVPFLQQGTWIQFGSRNLWHEYLQTTVQYNMFAPSSANKKWAQNKFLKKGNISQTPGNSYVQYIWHVPTCCHKWYSQKVRRLFLTGVLFRRSGRIGGFGKSFQCCYSNWLFWPCKHRLGSLIWHLSS